GRRAQCPLEGEPVAVDHIDKFNCFSCICKNGFVECKSDYYCPPTDGCHIHTEWTDPDNPCKVLRCEAGVITNAKLMDKKQPMTVT
ncbi:BMP-binding endothelial regulator protein, partial [Asbolus verrucosus]